MNNLLIDFSKFETANSKFTAKLEDRGGNITFSNSGKGKQKKFFSLSLDSFLACLKDIKKYNSEFQGHEGYKEKEWRDLGSKYFNDGPANAQSTVQTKGMFVTLSKIIMWANSLQLSDIDPEASINLEPIKINIAIEQLNILSNKYAPLIGSQINDQIVKHKYTGRFIFSVLKFLHDQDQLESIVPYFSKNNEPTYTSIKDRGISLTSIFKTSKNKLNKEDLSFNDGKPRFFEEFLFTRDSEYYYLSTEWTDGKASRLDLDSFKEFIKRHYPEYWISTIDSVHIFSLTENTTHEIEPVKFDLQKFWLKTKESGLEYSEEIVTRFVSSLATKPFVLLTGLSGSGKTKLAQSFAQWICASKKQYCIVPVGADWTNREPLLGYVNALNNEEYILPENGALKLIIEANQGENKKKPYFLILDEMNLSHVERYFADFLSVMESKDKFKLHSDEINSKSDVPFELEWPKNLFVIGTVNIDETTYMFSPKVLDRASAIEFRVNETEIEEFLKERKEITSITKMGASMGNSFVEIANNKQNEGDFSKLNIELLGFFKELQKLGAEFGYRTASEIQVLFSKIDLVNPAYSEKENEKIDIAIMQKLLPKLHGSRRKLLKTLNLLAQKCLTENQEVIFNERGIYNLAESNSIKYTLSFEKIARMYKNAIENGFASYAEA